MSQAVTNTAGKKPCPCLKQPFDECYCSQMNSKHVEDTLKYCNGNFMSCGIFKRRIGEIRKMFPDAMNAIPLEA